jgi:hypothetical protein
MTQESTSLNGNISILVFFLGVLWGVISLLRGLDASFTLNSTGVSLVKDLVALRFGFFIILPLAITAIWKPWISTAFLVVSLILVEIVGFSDDGLHGVYLVGKKLVLTLVLACGYAYVAFVRSKSPPRPPLPS